MLIHNVSFNHMYLFQIYIKEWLKKCDSALKLESAWI